MGVWTVRSMYGMRQPYCCWPTSASLRIKKFCSTWGSKYLWGLSALRFTELSNRQPALALGLAMAAGAVMAKRLRNSRRRVAAT